MARSKIAARPDHDMALISKAEASYIRTSLISEPPLRADGRSLHDYRPISLQTGVAPTANGSAKVIIGGTVVVAAVRLDVEDISDGEINEGGRISCTVNW